jgi:hypothetical protein
MFLGLTATRLFLRPDLPPECCRAQMWSGMTALSRGHRRRRRGSVLDDIEHGGRLVAGREAKLPDQNCARLGADDGLCFGMCQ